ncbi:MAG: hypothetical protein RBS19_06960 [Bacteroidales bacterium]|nr:hypothetical protein [Bacteroidales bacterium]
MNNVIADDAKIINKLLNDFDSISVISITSHIAKTLTRVVAKTRSASRIEKNRFKVPDVIFISKVLMNHTKIVILLKQFIIWARFNVSSD